MSDNAPASITPSAAEKVDHAVLALDATGRVIQAGAAAARLWKTESAALVGRPLPELFRFDVVSQEPDWIQSQWEVLLATALDRPLPLDASPVQGEPLAVRLRLEPASGGTVAYFATLTSGAPAPAAATPGASIVAGLPIHSARSPVGFFDLRLKEGAVHYSPAWKRLLGYAEHELEDTYDSWLRLIHPEDTGAAPDQVGRAPAGGGARAFSVEFRMKHQQGHWVWIQSSGTQIYNPAGELERVMGVHLDITERKELEEESLLADERLARLTGDGALAAFDLDFAAQRMWFSRAWLRLAGIEHDPDAETRLETLTDMLPEYVMEGGLENFFLAPATGQPSFVTPMALRRKDGTERMVQLGGHRQLSRKRELLRVVGYALPIPAAAAAGAAASSKIPMIEDALAALGEAVLVTDSSGAVIYLNPKAEQLTGCTREDARALKMNDVLQLVARSDGRSAADAVELMLASERETRLHSDHALVPVGGGEAVPITWTARQATDEEGRPRGVIVVFRNPQEMTLTPEELIRSNRFESLGQVAGGIAHDFNNFLTTILGSISLAKDNRDYSGLEDGEKACMAAKGLTKQLLAFAKGSDAASLQVLAPAELLRDAVRVATAGSPVRIHLEVDDEAGPVSIDRGQMIQVFQNLIINAIQAMPTPESGEIWLRCVNADLAAGQLPPLEAGRYVQMDVQDNGSGIPPEVLERIFDPFFTTKQTGTGLGLATVLSIVRKHGGQLGVNSVVGTGTTFTVFLPLVDRPVDTEARRAPALRFGTGRILFMDDDAKICELTGNMLASLDYTYDVARHGEEALTLYRRYLNVSRPYDAVIMDLTIIGGMGGEETFHKLRELDPDVRAIVSSGYDNDEMARRFLDMGFCGYLTKPYRVTDLGRVLKGVLG